MWLFFVVFTVPHPSANAAGWPLVHCKGKSQSDTGITLAAQTSEPCLCGQGRTVRHTGEFSTGNQDKQQIGGIKCQRGHCLLKRLVIKKRWNSKRILKTFTYGLQFKGMPLVKLQACWSLSTCLDVLSKDKHTCLNAVLRRAWDDEGNGEIIFPAAAELWFTFHLLFQQSVYFHWALVWILVFWQ